MNTDVVFSILQTVYVLQIPPAEERGVRFHAFNDTGRPRPFVATRFSKTNDTQSHKALAAARCRGRMPTV